MKIAIDVRMIESSGIGRVIKNILLRLICQNETWQFFLLGRAEELKNYEFTQKENVAIIPCNASIYSIREQFELWWKIPKQIELFWAPHYNIPLFYQGKLMVTIHDVFHLAKPEFVKGMHKKIYAKMMFASVAKKADKIICVSKFTAEELKKYTHVEEKKISVIYNGVDESWFQIRQGTPVHNKPYLLYVGNIKPHKNLVRLLKAFQKIKNNIPHDLILIGKQDGFITSDQEVIKLAETIKDRVVFTGYIEDSVLPQYFVQASLLVFPSLYEGFGLPPLEAMACCRPVLVSNVASMPEVCGAGAAYCDPYDVSDIEGTIIKLIANNELQGKLIEEGCIQSRKFLWDDSVEKMIKVIKKNFFNKNNEQTKINQNEKV